MKIEFFTIVFLPISFTLLALSGYQTEEYQMIFIVGFASTFGIGIVSAISLINYYTDPKRQNHSNNKQNPTSDK